MIARPSWGSFWSRRRGARCDGELGSAHTSSATVPPHSPDQLLHRDPVLGGPGWVLGAPRWKGGALGGGSAQFANTCVTRCNVTAVAAAPPRARSCSGHLPPDLWGSQGGDKVGVQHWGPQRDRWAPAPRHHPSLAHGYEGGGQDGSHSPSHGRKVWGLIKGMSPLGLSPCGFSRVYFAASSLQSLRGGLRGWG